MMWNPVLEMERMRRFLDDMSEGYDRADAYEEVNVYESENGTMMQFLAPGVKKEDVSIDWADNVLSISVSRKLSQGEKDKALRRERDSYKFTRSFRLPDEADVEKIEAKLSDGILLVSIPRLENARPKKISVKVS